MDKLTHPCRKQSFVLTTLRKILWQKKKMLVTSIILMPQVSSPHYHCRVNGHQGKVMRTKLTFEGKNTIFYFDLFFDLTLVPTVKIPIFTFLLPRLIVRASQPDGNMTSFTLHFSRLT